MELHNYNRKHLQQVHTNEIRSWTHTVRHETEIPIVRFQSCMADAQVSEPPQNASAIKGFSLEVGVLIRFPV